MKKPSRYYCQYEDEKLWQKELARVKKLYPGVTGPEELTDPEAYWREMDFEELNAARKFAAEQVFPDVPHQQFDRDCPVCGAAWGIDLTMLAEKPGMMIHKAEWVR